jgi:hypothetical protein
MSDITVLFATGLAPPKPITLGRSVAIRCEPLVFDRARLHELVVQFEQPRNRQRSAKWVSASQPKTHSGHNNANGFTSERVLFGRVIR